MENQAIIRPAISADIRAIQALASEAPTAATWSLENYAEIFNPDGPKRLVLVIKKRGAIPGDNQESKIGGVLGFLVAREVGQEWDIENIVVAGRARRKGLGSRLLGEFLDQVRQEGAIAVFLEVRESNRAARKLYEKWGFQATGRRRDYYHDPIEDAILYRLGFGKLAS